MALSSDEMHEVKLYIINNPHIRNIEWLSSLTGRCERTVRKALNELNIARSTKKKFYVG